MNSGVNYSLRSHRTYCKHNLRNIVYNQHFLYDFLFNYKKTKKVLKNIAYSTLHSNKYIS